MSEPESPASIVGGGKRGRRSRSVEKDDTNAELERLLVEGEMVTAEDGREVRVFPRSCEIAQRLGVSKSWVSKYARLNRCFERRAAFQNAVKAKAREKLVQTEANRIAFQTAEQLALCDTILSKYQEAIESRDVGNVTAADVNAIIRLRHFVQGDADQRSEVSTQTVTLEMMQEAHARLHRAARDSGGEDPVEVSPEAQNTSSVRRLPESKVDKRGGKPRALSAAGCDENMGESGAKSTSDKLRYRKSGALNG